MSSICRCLVQCVARGSSKRKPLPQLTEQQSFALIIKVDTLPFCSLRAPDFTPLK